MGLVTVYPRNGILPKPLTFPEERFAKHSVDSKNLGWSHERSAAAPLLPIENLPNRLPSPTSPALSISPRPSSDLP